MKEQNEKGLGVPRPNAPGRSTPAAGCAEPPSTPSRGTPIEHVITHQGSAVIEAVYAWQWGEDVVAIGIQTEMRCMVSGSGTDGEVPDIMIENLRVNDPVDTVVSFPQFKGWDVWSAEASKYTVHLCLARTVEPKSH